MEILKIETINPIPVLDELLDRMLNTESSDYLHLGHTKINNLDGAARAVLGLRVLGVNEHFLPAILKIMGIRSVTFNSYADPRPILSLNKMLEDKTGMDKIKEILNDKEALELIKVFFKNCKTVAFDDWIDSSINSEIWQALLDKVISTLDKDGFEFIFYLGDTSKKIPSEVDRIMGIITEFSKYGQVTLALDEKEAVHLWEIINGEQPGILYANQQSELFKKKYISLYNTIEVANILIYSTNSAMLFSNGLQFEISRQTVDPVSEISFQARDNFIAGFASGLLMNLDLVSCLTLGLIVFGGNGGLDDSEDDHIRLPNYLRKWISDLDQVTLKS